VTSLLSSRPWVAVSTPRPPTSRCGRITPAAGTVPYSVSRCVFDALPVTYQGVIFDFNGVLFWDADLQVQSWQQVAIDLRGRPLTDEECHTHMHGRTNAAVLQYLAGRPLTAAELHDLTQRKESGYRALCLRHPAQFVLSPGAESVLDHLTKRNILRTIATSSEKTNLDFFIEHFKLARWFDLSKIVFDDRGRPGKPAPDIYLHAADYLNLPPKNCIVIEDALSGIQSAHAAGIGHIIAIGPAATHPKLRAIEGVSQVIESLEEFKKW